MIEAHGELVQKIDRHLRTWLVRPHVEACDLLREAIAALTVPSSAQEVALPRPQAESHS
jgi:hypothetical protein